MIYFKRLGSYFKRVGSFLKNWLNSMRTAVIVFWKTIADLVWLLLAVISFMLALCLLVTTPWFVTGLAALVPSVLSILFVLSLIWWDRDRDAKAHLALDLEYERKRHIRSCLAFTSSRFEDLEWHVNQLRAHVPRSGEDFDYSSLSQEQLSELSRLRASVQEIVTLSRIPVLEQWQIAPLRERLLSLPWALLPSFDDETLELLGICQSEQNARVAGSRETRVEFANQDAVAAE